MDSLPVTNKNWRTTFERIEKFISNTYFTDVNLYGRLYGERQSVDDISTSGQTGRISYETAIGLEYKRATIGQSFGPTWATHWFLICINIPTEWIGKEVHLVWNSNSEAMIWKNGVALKGFNNDRNDFIISKQLREDQLSHTFHIEMACNSMSGAGDHFIGPPKPDKMFTLSTCQIAIFNRQVYHLIQDLDILLCIAKELPEDTPRKYQALYTANEMVNLSCSHESTGYSKARSLSSEFFNQHNGDSQLTVHAMGHAHIDTAWLWQYDETKRKCARSWASTIQLMDSYPDYKFVCSQAQQYEWVKDSYPELYQRISKFVDDGRFIPVGGTWVEMDGNLPSGEAFVRQFIYGQRFFQKEFGIKCKEFWLPDTFGYSAQLPQIMSSAGIQRFLTQKLSWGLINTFPHHTFWWQGIDGTKCLTHFPPADSYGTSATAADVLNSVGKLKDKGRTRNTVLLFGFGDGGGGPTEDMLERLDRLKDVDRIPKISQSTPDQFFDVIEKESSNLCRWIGELYLELHQGTFTTQAMLKRKNRRLEFMMHNIEFIYSMLVAVNDIKYPSMQLDTMWKKLLINQFHDVLPGSCIELVVQDALKLYDEIETEGSNLLQLGIKAITQHKDNEGENEIFLINTHCWDRSEVVTISGDIFKSTQPKNKKQKTDIKTALNSCGETLALVEVPSMGYSILQSPEDKPIPCTVKIEDEFAIMDNGLLTAYIDRTGRVCKLLHKRTGRNAFKEDASEAFYGNQFVLFDDVPLYWDAWDVMDYHMETRSPITNIKAQTSITEDCGLRCAVSYKLAISEKSWIKQDIVLDACAHNLVFNTQVEWHESHKLLKVEFPLDVRTLNATYEIQFGHLQRPTHGNTSWDWAKYEVVGHKWADMSEFGFGVSLLNDCKYGFSAKDNVLSMSLLRSSKSPDANADMGTHHFNYSVLPHTGTFQEARVVQAAYDFNNPLQVMAVKSPTLGAKIMSYFKVSNPAIILDTIKKAEDRDDALVVRLYEAYGGHSTGFLITSLPFQHAIRCNILEELKPTETMDINNGTIQLHLNPFQIISLILSFDLI
ncbi:alpha-mannosidase 2C1-like [Antedon mediterranea]|uniref:alpha-mannosidase 2C1-like n=1 Tax=Antedon mediterranea TaxID=105859 RepID=UPI003AF5256E